MRSGWFALGAVAALVGCGGGGGGGGGGGTCTPASTAAVAVTATGLSPMAVCVTPGGTVTFTNSDAVQHAMQADSGCVGFSAVTLAPSGTQSASAAVAFASAQTCTFHVADKAGDSAFQGTVAVSSTTTTGPGY
jgi:plastocyanin